jgi:hypothetical protein
MTAGSVMACVPSAHARSAGSRSAPWRHRDWEGSSARVVGSGSGSIAAEPKRCGGHRSQLAWNLTGSRWRWSCQNWRMAERPGSDPATVLSEELAACRKRGIERLDVHSHNQQPLVVPQLERLAAQYATATRSAVHGRIPQLKYLLWDALDAFRGENEMDAQLVSALFFGDSLHRVTKSAGELLDIAQRNLGYDSPVRFRLTRHVAFDNFAEFLSRFVAASSPAPIEDPRVLADDLPGETAPTLPPPDPAASAPAAEVERHVASTGYIDNGDHFVTLLSQAESITIIGYTNESLASMLRLALARKRAAMLRPDGCWSSVRVVFLSEDLLDRVNDERGYPDPGEARLLRRRLAVYGRRTVRTFLRSLPPRANWAIYDSADFPPLIGTLFEMPDRQRIVQLLIRRRQRSSSDHLYLELDDTRGHYFSAVFEEIVDSSTDDNKLVPVGRVVDGERFRATSTRFRRNVLLDRSDARGWLPMILVITWQMRGGLPEPLLQLRTQRNATRELHRFTHLAGHITQDSRAVIGREFGLEDHLPTTTAAQRVQMETGQSDPGELTPLTTGEYFHPDKEHLFFFVYACRLPDGLQLWPRAEMSALSVPELLSIRENQVFRKALALCQASPRRQVRAFEIVAQNLILHGYPDIAENLIESGAAGTTDLSAIATELSVLEERTRQTWPTYEGDAEVVGLSGFQFRNFFSTLMPFYESVGVPGAAQHLTLMREDGLKRAAADRLFELYNDERVMESVPLEL